MSISIPGEWETIVQTKFVFIRIPKRVHSVYKDQIKEDNLSVLGRFLYTQTQNPK